MMERQIPDTMQKTYDRAMTGKSKSAAIRALCQECMGYDRHEVALCSDTGCPLYLYRPYRGPKALAVAKRRAESERQGAK